MAIFHWIISALWILFAFYWAIAAIGAKRTVKTAAWWGQAGLRLALVPVMLVAYRTPAIRHVIITAAAFKAGGIAWGIAGTILVGLGIGLAIVARFYIGRNWGIPMSQKEDAELITAGPYGFVRHPIYSGIMLAMFGSMLGMSLLWLLPLVLFGIYFIYSARHEEELMCRQFPRRYPAYMARTRMLVPFLL